MRLIPYILYLFLIGFYLVILRDPIAIGPAYLNLAAFMVMAVATYKDDVTSAWFGFAVGLVTAASGPLSTLGWSALFLAVLALGAGYIRERLNLDALKAKLLLMLCGLFVYNIGALLLSGGQDFFINLVTVGLGSTAYTMILAWLFFLIKEGRITVQKVKELF